MTNQEIRLACLRIHVETSGQPLTVDQLVADAKKMSDFVIGDGVTEVKKMQYEIGINSIKIDTLGDKIRETLTDVINKAGEV